MSNLFRTLVIVNVNDKSCDVGEYLDYENCKCSKKLVDKLNEECTENIDEIKIAIGNKHKNKCSSCALYIVLFLIIFTINIGIVTYFVYFKCINHIKENISRYDYVYLINELINGRRQTNRDQKSSLLFLQRQD